MHDYLLAGKEPASLDGPAEVPIRDALIVNNDAPEKRLASRTMHRGIWINTSMKEAKFESCDFSHTIFINCYFRGACFTDCTFTGCRFVDCNFSAATLVGCKLTYTRWEKTDIPRTALLDNLPIEANLAQKLLIQLRLNSTSTGEFDDARFYLYEAEARSRQHYKEIFLCRTDYYRRKYRKSAGARIAAALRYARSHADRMIWGYGERPLRLSLNTLLLVFAFGTVYAVVAPVDWWEGIRLSFQAFVNLGTSEVDGAGNLSSWLVAESFLGVVYIAFLAASLHRRVATRRD